MKWTVQLIEDPETGDLILPLTPDILSQMGWDVGDTLLWEEMTDGGWCIKKQSTGTSEDAIK